MIGTFLQKVVKRKYAFTITIVNIVLPLQRNPETQVMHKTNLLHVMSRTMTKRIILILQYIIWGTLTTSMLLLMALIVDAVMN